MSVQHAIAELELERDNIEKALSYLKASLLVKPDETVVVTPVTKKRAIKKQKRKPMHWRTRQKVWTPERRAKQSALMKANIHKLWAAKMEKREARKKC